MTITCIFVAFSCMFAPCGVMLSVLVIRSRHHEVIVSGQYSVLRKALEKPEKGLRALGGNVVDKFVY